MPYMLKDCAYDLLGVCPFDQEDFSSKCLSLRIMDRGGEFFATHGQRRNQGWFRVTDGRHTIKAVLTKDCLEDIYNHVKDRFHSKQDPHHLLSEYSRNRCGYVKKYTLIRSNGTNELLLNIDQWDARPNPIENLMSEHSQSNLMSIQPIEREIHIRQALQRDDAGFGNVEAALANDNLLQQILAEAGEEAIMEHEGGPKSDDDTAVSPTPSRRNNQLSVQSHEIPPRRDDSDDDSEEETPNIDAMLATQESHSEAHQEEFDDDDDRISTQPQLFTQPMTPPAAAIPTTQQRHILGNRNQSPQRKKRQGVQQPEDDKKRSARGGGEEEDEQSNDRQSKWRFLVEETTDEAELAAASQVSQWKGLSSWLPHVVDENQMVEEEEDLGNIDIPLVEFSTTTSVRRRKDHERQYEAPPGDFIWDDDVIESCWNQSVKNHDQNNKGNMKEWIAPSLVPNNENEDEDCNGNIQIDEGWKPASTLSLPMWAVAGPLEEPELLENVTTNNKTNQQQDQEKEETARSSANK